MILSKAPEMSKKKSIIIFLSIGFFICLLFFAAAIVCLLQYDLYLKETEMYNRLIHQYERILFTGPLNVNTTDDQDLAILIEQTDKQIKVASSRIALESNNEKFIESLRQIAQQFDVEFEIKDITSSVKEFYIESAVTFTLKGTPPGPLKTINQIENLDRLISWQMAEFTEAGEITDNKKRLRARITIYTFAKRFQVKDVTVESCEIMPSELWLPPFSIWSAELYDQAYDMCQKQLENQSIAVLIKEYKAKLRQYETLKHLIDILSQHRKTFDEALVEATSDG